MLNDSVIAIGTYVLMRNNDNYWVISPLNSPQNYLMYIYYKKKDLWKTIDFSYLPIHYTYMNFEHFIFLQETYTEEKFFKGGVTIMDLEEGTVEADFYYGDYTRILNINTLKRYWLLSQPNAMMVLKKYDDVRKDDTRPSIIGNIPYSKAANTVFAWLEPVKTKKVYQIDAQGKKTFVPIPIAPEK